MGYLLILVIATLATGDILNLELSLAPGLSAKNLMVYLVALCLIWRIVTKGGYKLDYPSIHIWFVALICYAILSWLVADFIVGYQGYDLLFSGIVLKSQLLDYAIIFWLFFFGVRTISDGILVTGALLLAISLANAIAIGNVEGFFRLGTIVVGTRGAEAGRVFGTWGNANGTAALIVCFLPAYAAFALSGRGISTLFWLGAALPSAVMLIMTESRGAYVGAIVGYAWAAYSLRRYLSVRKIMIWVGSAVVLLAIATALAGSHFVDTLAERIVGQGEATDIGQASSGRSAVWAGLLGRMLSTPLTLITGFGWNSYSTMAYYFAPHNHYLALYFELGAVGLLSFVALTYQILKAARASAQLEAGHARAYLMAFVFGFSGLLVSVFFSQIYVWLYVWAYAGAALRMAACVAAEVKLPAAAQSRIASKVPSRRRAAQGI